MYIIVDIKKIYKACSNYNSLQDFENEEEIEDQMTIAKVPSKVKGTDSGDKVFAKNRDKSKRRKVKKVNYIEE